MILLMNYYLSLDWILVVVGFILQGKRGIEKQPFQLPDFIAATGIEKIRQVASYSTTLVHITLAKPCFQSKCVSTHMLCPP